MMESVIIAIIRQAAQLTKPQQAEFADKVAEAIATLVKGTKTGLDDEIVRQVALPIAGEIISRLEALI